MCEREREYVWKRERERTNLGSTNYSLTQLGYLMGPSHSVYQALWDDHDNAEGWLFSCLVLTVSLAPRAVPSVYYVVLRENGGLLTNVEEVLILSFDSFWGPCSSAAGAQMSWMVELSRILLDCASGEMMEIQVVKQSQLPSWKCLLVYWYTSASPADSWCDTACPFWCLFALG